MKVLSGMFVLKLNYNYKWLINKMKVILYLLFSVSLSCNLFAQTFNIFTTSELRTAITTSATNSEDDTIVIADGIYKTTDDGGGTFIFLSNEVNTLTLQGSAPENVILSGDGQHRVLKIKGTLATTKIYINGITIQDGYVFEDEGGGGIYSNLEIHLDNIKLYNNTIDKETTNLHSQSIGSALFQDWALGTRSYINNSIISHNISSSLNNGHGTLYGKINIENSTISNNNGGAILVSEANEYKNLIISDNNYNHNIKTCNVRNREISCFVIITPNG